VERKIAGTEPLSTCPFPPFRISLLLCSPFLLFHSLCFVSLPAPDIPSPNPTVESGSAVSFHSQSGQLVGYQEIQWYDVRWN